MLPLRARVHLGAMAMKEYSLQHYRSLTIGLFCVVSRIHARESYPSAKMQSVYSAAPTDWAGLLDRFGLV